MKRFPPVLGALVLVAAVVGYVVWQRPEAAPRPPGPLKDVVLQYADGSRLWGSADGGPKSWLVTQVLAELSADVGLPLDQLRRSGGVVRTTIDVKAQTVAAAVVGGRVSPQRDLIASMTAIDPATGGVRVYVPGDGRVTDMATGVLKEPGQGVLLPFKLVAALQMGETVDSVSVRNVMQAARQAGVPEKVVVDGRETKLDENQTRMRPLDVTAAYATFAAGGVQRRPHFVAKVTGEDGSVLYNAVDTGKPAFHADPVRSKEIADQVAPLLKERAACNGVACVPSEYPSPSARGQNMHAWMVGYTPQLAVTVFVGSEDGVKPAVDQAGAAVDGTGLPRVVWQEFLAALAA